MTPKEKAEELILKFREVPTEGSLLWYVGYEISKEFALIAVDYIRYSCEWNQHLYWLEVKQEIEKL